MTYPTYRENKPLDPVPWALFAASGIEIDRHADPRTASEFDPRAEYEQDRKKYHHYASVKKAGI